MITILFIAMVCLGRKYPNYHSLQVAAFFLIAPFIMVAEGLQ